MAVSLAGFCTPPDSTDVAPFYEEYNSKAVYQKFNPVFGSEKEANEIISFMSSNLVVKLDPDALKQLDGYLVIRFEVDTLGMIGKLKVQKSYNSWVDHAILGAIKELPEWGVPPVRNGKIVSKWHNIVFTFGSYVGGEGTYGFQDETVARNTQNEIDRQRDEHFAKINEKNKEWNDFTDINSKLEYDIKDGLKQEATTLPGVNPLQTPDDEQRTIPTIKITQQD